MAREQELQQQKPSHTATSRQKPRQTSLLKIRQLVTKHRHQEASAQERRRRSQRERIHRVKHNSMHKAQNKGSTSNPSIATTKSLRMVEVEGDRVVFVLGLQTKRMTWSVLFD